MIWNWFSTAHERRYDRDWPSLRGPIPRTAGASGVAAPCPPTRGAGKPAYAGSVFIMNRHRGADRAGAGDVSFELYEIGMRHNPVGDIDGEAVAGIACASLRHEEEVPRAIIRRPRVCGRRQGHKAAYYNYPKSRGVHDQSPYLSTRLASLARGIDLIYVRLLPGAC